ncbi:hypothetical protein CDAR_289341 [Caerostris darwini]|uniref:Uncharacterized protein n=1 Tax=Caerostris darwini TaxID=1538125 RepID=A0AAV4PFQ9_9ARAC|nr:hypothetical protein CDAR_289341 [Caerostris darwini]
MRQFNGDGDNVSIYTRVNAVYTQMQGNYHKNLLSRQAVSYCELVEGLCVAGRYVPGIPACGAQRAGSGPAGSGRLAQQLRLPCLQQQHLPASDHISHGRHESQHCILKLKDTSDRDISVRLSDNSSTPAVPSVRMDKNRNSSRIPGTLLFYWAGSSGLLFQAPLSGIHLGLGQD